MSLSRPYRHFTRSSDPALALILHPLPRTVELDKSVDADPRAMYFRQAMNGLYVRMALLTMLLDRE